MKAAGCKQAVWKEYFFKRMHNFKVTAFTVKYKANWYHDLLQI